MPDPDGPPAPAANPAPTPRGGAAPRLARELTGDLPCVRCRYNLKGLTVRGMCPECGLSVRTTLLAVIDPFARELRPIPFPRLTAFGVVLWAAAAVVASLAAWGVRLTEVSAGSEPASWARWAVVIFAGLSGVGAVALVRPHGGIRAGAVAMAAVGVLAYGPLVWALFRIHLVLDPFAGSPYRGAAAAAPAQRTLWRLAASACMVVILVCLRPNARLLASRWLLMRIGAVDRQTMLAMAAVVGVWSLGDGLHLLSPRVGAAWTDIARNAGSGLILVGSMMFTVGLFGVLHDVWRLKDVILHPPVAEEDLVGGEETKRGRDEETGR